MAHNRIAQADAGDLPWHTEPRNRGANGRLPIFTSLNVTLIGIVLSGTLFQLFGMPVVFVDSGVRSVWLLLPIAMLQPLHWGLIHEAIHGNLLPNRGKNEFWARLLSVLIGLPFDATHFGHLVHHRYPRHNRDRPDVYDGRRPYVFSWLLYRVRLFGGVYAGLFAAPLISCVPSSLGVRIMKATISDEDGIGEVQRLFVALVTNARKRRRTRYEFAMTLALYGASVWAYGSWWPMLLASMYVRGIWHSFADNIAHRGVSLNDDLCARNYKLPKALRPLVMNHHLHLSHHLSPSVPWVWLDSLNVPEEPSSYFRAALRQTKGCYPVRVMGGT